MSSNVKAIVRPRSSTCSDSVTFCPRNFVEMLGAHVGLIDEHEAAGVIDQLYPRVWQLLAEPLGHRGAIIVSWRGFTASTGISLAASL